MSISGNGHTLLSVPVLLFLAFGFLCLFVRGVVWINILEKIDLSISYPITSLSIVLVMIISLYLFNESITINKILGWVFIVVGSIIITLTEKND